jgi:nucleoside-diphosphate-sugar epimerase
LAESFYSNGGRRLVATGTCYEYDQQLGICSEHRTPLQSNTVYGTAKATLFQQLTEFSRSTALSFAWPRLFFLYGPGEQSRRLVSSVITSLLDGQPARCSHGRQRRDYMYVEDAAEGLLTLLASNVRGPINLARGTAVSLRAIVELIGHKLARPDLIELGALPARPEEVPLVVADTTRQSVELDWRPATSLDAGLERTIVWWHRQLQLAGGTTCQGS